MGCWIWKKPVALNHEVERIIRLDEIALRENDFVRRRLGAEAKLQPRGNRGRLARRGAGLDHVLVEQVLELRAAGLIAGGIRVGKVVGDVIHVELLRVHSAGGTEECSDHIV